MIKASIYDKKLVVENFAVSDGMMFDTVKFTFPDNWNGYAKTAIFKTEDGQTFNVVLDGANPLCVNENECYIPYEVIKSAYFYLSVFGVLDDSIATTTSVKVKVLQSGYAEGAEPSEPTPTEYQQLINLTQETKEIAQSVRVDADNGVFNGEQGIQGEKGEKGDKGDKGDTGEVTLEYANNTFAPAIKNTVSGEVVKVNDVSSIGHNLKIQLKNSDEKENLITYQYNNLPTEKNGITVTDNGDGSITLNGTAKYFTDIVIMYSKIDAGRYNFYFSSENISGATLYVGFTSIDTNYYSGDVWVNTEQVLSISEKCSLTVAIHIQDGTVLENVTVYPRVEREIVDFSGITVSRYGKNLFDGELITGCWLYSNSAFSKSTNYICSKNKIRIVPNTAFIVSVNSAIGKCDGVLLYDVNEEYIGKATMSFSGQNIRFTTPNNAVYANLNIYGENISVGDVEFVQLEVGTTATEYEPYKESQIVIANADGTVAGITSTSPNMTLVTDIENVIVNLTYNVDTKTYIDNKFTELSATILNN